MEPSEPSEHCSFIDMAAGKKPADLVLANARIVDVFTPQIVHGCLALAQGRILGIGDYQGEEVLDMHDRYILPGLIDAHVHIESSMLSPRYFAQCVLPHGTTTVIADPHEIANVLGMEGIRYMLEASQDLHLNFFFMLPSCVPATPFENSGASLSAKDLAQFIDEKRILGLGEMMNVPGIINSQPDVLAKLELALARGKLVDGHSPGLSGKQLNAYTAAGISTDHECSTVQEMHDRINRGMYVFLRQGSAAQNLETLVQGLTPSNARRCALCTDDRHPEDILAWGHLEHLLRLAVACKVPPLTAINLATLNPAQCYGLHRKGALAPGYDADLCIVDDLKSFSVSQVYSRGRLVAQQGQALVDPPPTFFPKASVVLGQLHARDLQLKVRSKQANVIRVLPHSILTQAVIRPVQADADGLFDAAFNPDLNLISVIERHKATGNVGLALIENFGLQIGAIATTVAHDSHNIVLIGTNSADMLKAVQDISEMGGGMSLCHQGRVLAHLPLPIAGLMCDSPAPETAEKLKEMTRLAREHMGVNPDIEPFMNLSFLALPVIPELKITDKGLFDVRKFTFVDLFV
ncbi:MAG: adenine deaminase [Desulfohalobiaceae bacterium]